MVVCMAAVRTYSCLGFLVYLSFASFTAFQFCLFLIAINVLPLLHSSLDHNHHYFTYFFFTSYIFFEFFFSRVARFSVLVCFLSPHITSLSTVTFSVMGLFLPCTSKIFLLVFYSRLTRISVFSFVFSS